MLNVLNETTFCVSFWNTSWSCFVTPTPAQQTQKLLAIRKLYRVHRAWADTSLHAHPVLEWVFRVLWFNSGARRSRDGLLPSSTPPLMKKKLKKSKLSSSMCFATNETNFTFRINKLFACLNSTGWIDGGVPILKATPRKISSSFQIHAHLKSGFTVHVILNNWILCTYIHREETRNNSHTFQ